MKKEGLGNVWLCLEDKESEFQKGLGDYDLDKYEGANNDDC